MLGRSAIHAIRALLELAEAPQLWRSVHDLAEAQQLPEPLLEQLMLRLRRAAILEARRGRRGGYRLARPAAAIPLAAILDALASHAAGKAPRTQPAPAPGGGLPGWNEESLGLTNLGLVLPELADPEREDPEPAAEGGSAGAETADREAAARVTAALERRLRQALERELARCTLEELHHDLRSARASLSEDGGLLLG